MPTKLHSCHLKSDKNKDACSCWIMFKAMDNNAVLDNPIITRLPKEISSQSCEAVADRIRLKRLADIPALREKKKGSKLEDHVSIWFEQPSSDQNLTLVERGTPFPAPRTYSLDATSFPRAVSTMVMTVHMLSRNQYLSISIESGIEWW